MTIIYIANARIPTEKAHGLQIMQMCGALANEGQAVELVIPRRINWIKDDPFDYYGLKSNFKITKLPCLDFIAMDKLIGRLGLWLESTTFFLSVFFYLSFRKADIIYTRDKFFLPLAIIKKNIIFEAHTFPRNYFLYSFFLKKVKGVVAITQKLKELFGGNAIVAPDGVDLKKFSISNSQFSIREKLGLPQDKKIVLYAGHLYEWKGAQTLAEASRYLPEDAEVYFVGGAKEDIERFKSQNSNLKIHVVGHRPHREIPLWLKAADVLVLPNSAKEDISKHWTSPMKMFEYMASGRPIVASSLPSIREVLSQDNAMLVNSDDPKSLADGIRKVIMDDGLAGKISARALEDVKNYTWAKRAQKICAKLINT